MSRLVIGAAALTVAAAAAFPAAAQFFDRPFAPYAYNNPPPIWGVEPRDDYARPLPPVAVVNRLEDQGYDDVGRPRYDGSTYVVDATAPNGRRVRLVIDAFRGRLLDRRPLGRGAREEDDDEPPRAFSRRGEPPPEMPFFDQPRRPAGPDIVAPRREAARPIEPAQPRALRPPADPRLAPSPAEPRTEAPAAPARREAARPAPTTGGQPYGVNPGAPASRRPPAEAARPATPAPNAAAAASGPSTAPKAEASADPARASKPVRVIGGVTPMNPDGPKPAPEPSE